jgi:hypothetical protein
MATKAKGKATTKAASKPAKKVPAIPPGYEGVTPYLTVRGAQQALDWARWKNSGRRWSRAGCCMPGLPLAPMRTVRST